jgi:hypothetical protein
MSPSLGMAAAPLSWKQRSCEPLNPSDLCSEIAFVSDCVEARWMIETPLDRLGWAVGLTFASERKRWRKVCNFSARYVQ